MLVNTIKKSLAARFAMTKELYSYAKTYRKEDRILSVVVLVIFALALLYFYSLSRS